MVCCGMPATAQRVPDPNSGLPRLTQWGIMDGNRVRTLFANHGEISRWPDQPSGEWPKGSGRSYVDGVALIVSARTRDAQGNVIYPMSTNYREFIDRDPETLIPWGWAAVPGYSNPRQPSPAVSNNPATWPPFWPDRPIDWAGEWNGYFGRGVQNADLETYFVFDDAPDREWTLAPHRFFPCPGDTTRGGLGLEVAARAFQWSHPLAQDVVFWHYEITNECQVDLDDVYFAQYIDWGIGGTADSGDDEGAFNKSLDLAFAWDRDGIGQPGAWGPVGTAGYAFLESPGNATNGTDDDNDGITDERRNSGPGQRIDGQDAIRAYVTANYNLAAFERFYGPLDMRPAYQAGVWWTGDENMNWMRFDDLNGNGVWDPGEPLNDDLGEDGLGPQHPNYPGPDRGEGDGQPTAGEPNFDALDKDESDQIGLTGFAVFDVHRYSLIDDAENYRLFANALPPLDDVLLEGGRNLGMFFSSGPFPLRAGQTERFSMALLFAEKDFTDARRMENSSLARKKRTVQQIYNANYRFARPPDLPTVQAFAGDGQVTLLWDKRAEQSFDPFLQEFDFEGYLVLRSTEPFFEEATTITNAFGENILQKAIAQYDLKNGLRGLHPVSIDGVRFNLGNDTGLRHSFVDRDVINGQTYYYAVVAYDRGLVQRDAEGRASIDPDGTVEGIAPSMTSFVIRRDFQTGVTTTDRNTAVVTPRAPAAGFVAPEAYDVERSIRGTAPIDLTLVAPTPDVENRRYALRFQNSSPWNVDAQPSWTVTDERSGEVLAQGTSQPGLNELPLVDGILMTFTAPDTVALAPEGARVTGGSVGTYRVMALPGTSSTAVARSRFVPVPHDYTLHRTSAFADTSLVLAFGQRAIPTPFYITDQTTGRRADFIIVEDVDSLRNGRYDDGDLVILVHGLTPTEAPRLQGGAWRASWAIRFFPPDSFLDEGVPLVPPTPGTVVSFGTTRPFATGDQLTFSVSPPGFDTQLAADRLREVYVVPNPYVATNPFEPSIPPDRSGRGERRIWFMNLPPRATVRIYTLTGELVQTLQHDSSVDNGQMSWDLVSRDGMNIAYGIYLYHIDAPEVGQHVGRFAVIK